MAVDILLNEAITENINTGQTTVFAMSGKNLGSLKCISWKIKKDPAKSKEQLKKLFKALKFGNKPCGIVKAEEKKTIRLGSITMAAGPTIVVDSELPNSLTSVMFKKVLGTSGNPTIQVDTTGLFSGAKLEADAEEDDAVDNKQGIRAAIRDIDETFSSKFTRDSGVCLSALLEEKESFPAFKQRLQDLLDMDDDEFDELDDPDKEADLEYAQEIDLDTVEGLLNKTLSGFESTIDDIKEKIGDYIEAEDDTSKLTALNQIQEATATALGLINHGKVTEAIEAASNRFRGLDQSSFFTSLPDTLNELSDICKFKKRALTT